MLSEKIYYHKLPLPQQILYKKIYGAIKRYDEYIMCGEGDCTEQIVDDVLRAIVSDNPDIFYVRPGDAVFEQTPWGILKIHPQYFFQNNDKKIIESEIEKQKELIFKEVDIVGKDNEEIIKSVHDVLIRRTYIRNISEEIKPGDCTIIGALLENCTTSEGIALTYKYLLNSLDIKCNIIYAPFCTSQNNGGPHVCNIVNLYGANRYIDVGENILRSSNDSICYEFFGLTEEMLKKNYLLIDDADVKNTTDFYDESVQTENNDKTSALDRIDEDGISIECINIENNLNLVSAISILKKFYAEFIEDDYAPQIEKLIKKLKMFAEIGIQYPDIKDDFDEHAMKHLPDLIRILQEYNRYKKYAANSSVTAMVYTKLSQATEMLSNFLQQKLDIFWNKRAGDMITSIGGMQESIESENSKRKIIPFDLENLENQKDIDYFIDIFQFLQSYGLPKEFSEYFCLITNGLKQMKKVLSKKDNSTGEIERFIQYYLPEAINLVFHYDEYQVSGMDKDTLNEIYIKIKTSLFTINNAIELKLNEIYSYDAIQTKARASALTTILKQDGYSETGDYLLKL